DADHAGGLLGRRAAQPQRRSARRALAHRVHRALQHERAACRVRALDPLVRRSADRRADRRPALRRPRCPSPVARARATAPAAAPLAAAVTARSLPLLLLFARPPGAAKPRRTWCCGPAARGFPPRPRFVAPASQGALVWSPVNGRHELEYS